MFALYIFKASKAIKVIIYWSGGVAYYILLKTNHKLERTIFMVQPRIRENYLIPGQDRTGQVSEYNYGI